MATGGDGNDDFHLLDIGANDPPMQITDFNPHEDSLVVMYDAAIHPDPQLTDGNLRPPAPPCCWTACRWPTCNRSPILILSSITLQAA